jgi:hypothetical protein
MIQVKGNNYTINTMAIGDSKVLVKNNNPVLMIPDELVEDFINILVAAGAAEKLFSNNSLTNKINMKIELKKVNEPNGKFWYGIWVDGDCQTPSFGTDLEAAKVAYEEIKEVQKNPPPPYETIQEETI